MTIRTGQLRLFYVNAVNECDGLHRLPAYSKKVPNSLGDRRVRWGISVVELEVGGLSLE